VVVVDFPIDDVGDEYASLGGVGAETPPDELKTGT
jgi:hypothetical protein